MTAGLPLLLICLAMLEAALFAKALWLFLAGTVIGGVAVGFVFRGSLSELNRLADPRHRAGVVSTFFAAAYIGLGLTAVLTGLISLRVTTVDAQRLHLRTRCRRRGCWVRRPAKLRHRAGPNRRAHPVTPGARRRNQPAGAGRVSVAAGGELARGASD